jgi:hypothetical protein
VQVVLCSCDLKQAIPQGHIMTPWGGMRSAAQPRCSSQHTSRALCAVRVSSSRLMRSALCGVSGLVIFKVRYGFGLLVTWASCIQLQQTLPLSYLTSLKASRGATRQHLNFFGCVNWC